jgi:hypothetical protein
MLNASETFNEITIKNIRLVGVREVIKINGLYISCIKSDESCLTSIVNARTATVANS